MKKCISIFLFAALIFTLCACNITPTPSQTGTTAATTTAPTTTPTTTVAAPVKISFAINLHVDDAFLPQLPFFQEFEKRTNVEFEFTTIPSDTAKEKLSLILSSGNIPDIVNIESSQANAYGEDGLFEPLDTLIDQYAPNIKAMIVPDEIKFLRNQNNGQLYIFPSYFELNVVSNGGISYRKDILDAMGESEPTTMDGWYQLFKKVKTQYAELSSVLCERGRWVDAYTHQAFGMGKIKGNYGFLARDLDSHTVVFLPATNEWKEMLQFYNKLFTEDLMNKDYLDIPYPTWWDNTVCAGKAFACFTQNFYRCIEANDAAKAAGIEQNWVTAKYPQNQTGKSQILSAVTPWLTSGFAISATSKVKEKAMEVLDYSCSDEGMILYFYGIEGTTYKLVDGKPVRIPEELSRGDWDLMKKEKLGFSNSWPSLRFISILDMSIPDIQAQFDLNNPLIVKLPIISIVNGNDEYTALYTDLDAFVQSSMDKFITGQDSFDNWDAYLTKLEQLKMKQGLEIVQASVDNFYK